MQWPLFEIGFFSVRLWDVLDVLIVAYLIYFIYKNIKDSLALYIFLGIVFVYITWGLTNALGMITLSSILNTLISVGIIAILIVFQPEVRRFLLLLGKNAVRGRGRRLLAMLGIKTDSQELNEPMINQLVKNLEHFSQKQLGALILFTENPDYQTFSDSGIRLNAQFSSQLLEIIFHKESPMHDGAVVISEGRIHAASCILPVSENLTLPTKVGLRHRSAVGATEGTDVLAIIVSEENGSISYAYGGELFLDIGPEWARHVIKQWHMHNMQLEYQEN
jgi:diadenylate cyclase